MKTQNHFEKEHTIIKKWAWLFILLVAFGGLWLPQLGLLLLPMMLTLMIMGLLKGKYWCGHFCPHGSLFDYLIPPVSLKHKMPRLFKSPIIQGAAFGGFMYMLGMRLAAAFQSFGEASFAAQLGAVFVMNYLVVTILGTLLAVFIKPRTWCTVCPMGTMQVLMYKLGRVLNANKRTDKKIVMHSADKCVDCGKCAKVCPMQLSPYDNMSENSTFENVQCIRCEVCVKAWPTKVLLSKK